MRPGTVRSALRSWIDPANLFDTIYSAEDTYFWLDAGTNAESGMSFLG